MVVAIAMFIYVVCKARSYAPPFAALLGTQVRPADVHTERENKLFIGMLPKTVDEGMIETLFAQFGKIKEIHVIRTPEVRGAHASRTTPNPA